ncbi:MAG: hypothetical protein U0L49_09450 [Eubacterium sp.]|nr:hypothetical protein [Eubacterium sp.]
MGTIFIILLLIAVAVHALSRVKRMIMDSLEGNFKEADTITLESGESVAHYYGRTKKKFSFSRVIKEHMEPYPGHSYVGRFFFYAHELFDLICYWIFNLAALCWIGALAWHFILEPLAEIIRHII